MSKKYSEVEKEILREISCFIFHREKDAERANSYVNSFGITDISYNEKTNEVSITLFRPGLFIGNKGELIKSLQEYLQKEVNENLKIFIIENRINEYFVNFARVFDF